jgi:hypothetical protein
MRCPTDRLPKVVADYARAVRNELDDDIGI